MILSCQNICKAFIENKVLENISFHIEDYEKAAIVGINGAGKTTLLRILVGETEPDEGSVTLAKNKTLGYLAQDGAVDTSNTIYEELLSVKQHLIDLEHRIRECENAMPAKQGNELEALMKQYANLTHAFESDGGYTYKSEITGVLKGLGFAEEEFAKPVSTLSGGQKTRVALSKLLLKKPDLIILDEPTNHLDMNSIAWLETYLMNYKGAVVVVSHDRYFLNRIATKVIEIDQTKATTFMGNYSDYAVKKEQLRTAAMHAYLNQQREIKHQEAVIEKLRSFNREKSIRRAQSREKMLEKIEVIEKPTEARADMHIKLVPRKKSGNDVLTVEDLGKSFGSNLLFEHVNLEIKRGEHVAVIGDNGTGKTTLLKILNNLLPADQGSFRLGTNVEIGYYDQEHHVLHAEKTLFEEISDEHPTLNNTEIRNILAAFLFTGDDVFKRIDDLSGGERGRVSLAKLMLSNANFLILDEPTNHLDIVSKEILEDALNSYEGTVLYVSHDRYFINKTAGRILDLEGKRFVNYIGNYDYYLEKHDAVSAAAGIYAGDTGSGANSSFGVHAPSATGTGSNPYAPFGTNTGFCANTAASTNTGFCANTGFNANTAAGTNTGFNANTAAGANTGFNANTAAGANIGFNANTVAGASTGFNPNTAASTNTGSGPYAAGIPRSGNSTAVPAAGFKAAESESKLDWKAKKEEQARIRKKENDLRKCEEKITALEERNSEIDTLMADPSVATQAARLQELAEEQAEIGTELEKLYEEWAALAE